MLYDDKDLSFYIQSVERFYHSESRVCEKAPPFASLSFCVNGSYRFIAGEKELFVRAGDVLFIPSELSFEVDYSVSESVSVLLESCSYREAEAYRLKNPNVVSLMFLELLRSFKEKRSQNGAKSAFYAILEKIESDVGQSEDDTAFSRCLQYVKAHFCDSDLSVANICSKSFVSVSSLRRSFVEHFGLSPMQYVTKLRMEKALQLLSDECLSVKEVSFMCGFEDEKYFSRAFKNYYGYPPSQLREYIGQYFFVNKSCHKE